jgi:hypothetical protein
VRQTLSKRLKGDLAQAAQRIVRLAHYDTQVALQLARMCFAHEAIYLLRVHTPEEVALFAPAFDHVWVTLRGIPFLSCQQILVGRTL